MAQPLSSRLDWVLMNPILSAALNPILANPITSAQVISNVPLVAGKNTIPHRLGRQMQGWFFTDIQALANVYRSAPFNDTTLTLTSDAPVIVNIGVF